MEDILLLWKTTSEELQRQLPRETYDTLLRPATLLAAGDDTLTVAAHSEGARDWLQSRLDPVIRRTLRSVAGREINVVYEVKGGSHV